MLTKKRHPKNKALSKVITGRLEELRLELKLNYQHFATAAGVPRSQYNSWRNGGSVPGGFYLCRISERLGVTTDWLLGLEGAPKHPNQWRSETALADDFAEHTARAVATRFSIPVGEVTVDRSRILLDATTAIVDRCQQDADRAGRAWPLARESAHIKTILADLGARARADGAASAAGRATDDSYDFIVDATRTNLERVERLREGVEDSAWTGPVRIGGGAVARLLSGPGGRANRTADERNVGNFAKPERRPATELDRQRALREIVGDDGP